MTKESSEAEVFGVDQEGSTARTEASALIAGRALDAMIAEKFWGIGADGWPEDEASWKWWMTDEDGVRCPRLPRFSTNIGDAWAVLDLMAAPGFVVRINASGAGTFDVEWTTTDEDNEHYWLAEVTDVDSAPFAICLAALRKTR